MSQEPRNPLDAVDPNYPYEEKYKDKSNKSPTPPLYFVKVGDAPRDSALLTVRTLKTRFKWPWSVKKKTPLKRAVRGIDYVAQIPGAAYNVSGTSGVLTGQPASSFYKTDAPAGLFLLGLSVISYAIEVYQRWRNKKQRRAYFLVEKLAGLPFASEANPLVDAAREWQNCDRKLLKKFFKELQSKDRQGTLTDDMWECIKGGENNLTDERNLLISLAEKKFSPDEIAHIKKATEKFRNLKKILEEKINDIKEKQYGHNWNITLALTSSAELSFKAAGSFEEKISADNKKNQSGKEQKINPNSSKSLLKIREFLNRMFQTKAGKVFISFLLGILLYVSTYSVLNYLGDIISPLIPNFLPFSIWWLPAAGVLIYFVWELYHYCFKNNNEVDEKNVKFSDSWECYECTRALYAQEYYGLFSQKNPASSEPKDEEILIDIAQQDEKSANALKNNLQTNQDLSPIKSLKNAIGLRRFRFFISGFMDGFLATFICFVFAKFLYAIGIITLQASSHGLIVYVLIAMGCVLGFFMGFKRTADSEYRLNQALNKIDKSKEELNELQEKEQLNTELRNKIGEFLKSNIKNIDIDIFNEYKSLGLLPKEFKTRNFTGAKSRSFNTEQQLFPERNWYSKRFFSGFKIKNDPVWRRILKKLGVYSWVFLTQSQSGIFFIKLFFYTGGIWAGVVNGLTTVVLAGIVGVAWSAFKIWEAHLQNEENNNLNFLYERRIRLYSLDVENKCLKTRLDDLKKNLPKFNVEQKSDMKVGDGRENNLFVNTGELSSPAFVVEDPTSRTVRTDSNVAAPASSLQASDSRPVTVTSDNIPPVSRGLLPIAALAAKSIGNLLHLNSQSAPLLSPSTSEDEKDSPPSSPPPSP